MVLSQENLIISLYPPSRPPAHPHRRRNRGAGIEEGAPGLKPPLQCLTFIWFGLLGFNASATAWVIWINTFDQFRPQVKFPSAPSAPPPPSPPSRPHGVYLVSKESNRKCWRSTDLKKLTYAAGRWTTQTTDKSVSDKLYLTKDSGAKNRPNLNLRPILRLVTKNRAPLYSLCNSVAIVLGTRYVCKQICVSTGMILNRYLRVYVCA